MENKEEVKKFELTSGQQEAINALQNWWASDNTDIVLSGSPGTGKTFLAKYFANNLPKCVPLFTAPTNEAVRQLELSLDNNAATKTTYSALGLKLSISSYKQNIYQSKLPEDFYDYNLLIIDESSMAGKRNTEDKKAHDLLMDYVQASGLRRIWLGDWAQLPPVESETGTSPVFGQGFQTLELTQVKRHAGAILDFAIELREILKQPLRNMPSAVSSEIGQRKRNSEGLIDFSNDEFEEILEDKARILTWTNGRTACSKIAGVREYNNKIRSIKFGEARALESDTWPEDRLLFASPLFEVKHREQVTLENLKNASFELIASVNTRAEVVSQEKCMQFGVECWKAHLELEGGSDVIAYIPTRDGAKQKAAMEKDFMKIATSQDSAVAAGKAWAYYHTFRQLFADVKHTYCVTTHRAQGSTIDTVFVDVGNILQNRDRLVAFKSLYVAATRAKNKLNLIR